MNVKNSKTVWILTALICVLNRAVVVCRLRRLRSISSILTSPGFDATITFTLHLTQGTLLRRDYTNIQTVQTVPNFLPSYA